MPALYWLVVRTTDSREARGRGVALAPLKAGEPRLGVFGAGRVVPSNRLLGLPPAQTRVENRLRERRTDRPKATRHREPLGGVGAARAVRPRQSQRRKIGRFRHADLRVGRGDAALGGRNVGPALEQL